MYVQAFPRECTEAFLEGYLRAFAFFGGVPTRISYDNSKIMVAQIVGSRERKVTGEFLRLRSHFLFADHFCLVRQPNEKGHVERLLDFARRNFLVPVPRVNSLEILNRQLEERCRADLTRHRGRTVISCAARGATNTNAVCCVTPSRNASSSQGIATSSRSA